MTGTEREVAGERTRADCPPIVWPLGAFVTTTVLLAVCGVDLGLSQSLFDANSGTWYFERTHFLDFVDHVGPYAGIAIGVGALATFVLGFWVPRLEHHRLPALFLALVAIVGPFLIVNAIGKGSWGRPRPNNLAEFGAEAEYREFWSPGTQPGIHKSFPSGHASIGFYLVAPAFLFYRRNRRRFALLFSAGLAYGTMMSASRVLQGSHFVTDVLWAAGVVYLTCAVLYRVIDPEGAADSERADESDSADDQPGRSALEIAA